MKKLKRIAISFLAVCMLFISSINHVSAANGSAGSTVTVKFSFSKIGSLDGNISYDDPNSIISSIKISKASFSNASVQKSDTSVYINSIDGEAISGSITVSVTLKASAQVGQTATIRFTGGATNLSTGDYASVSKSDTVKVIEKTSGGGGGSSNEPTVTINTADIKVQIANAEKLDKKNYSADSWNALQAALKTAQSSLTSNSQANVDKACADLKAAIANLVLMDYSRLQEALQEAEALIDSEDVEKWRDLVAAMIKNKELLKSNDQVQVEKAADEIYDILDQIRAMLALTENDVVIKDGDIFCNVGLHKVWPILFFISLAGNAALVYMLVSKTKRRFNDNTPVVDYDINDDDRY